MDDYISRQAAIIEMMDNDVDHAQGTDGREVVQILSDIPAADVVPAEPQEIGYDQCANAMLKMWIDNVVTDGEYNRVMDRLNKLYFSGGERKE